MSLRYKNVEMKLMQLYGYTRNYVRLLMKWARLAAIDQCPAYSFGGGIYFGSLLGFLYYDVTLKTYFLG